MIYLLIVLMINQANVIIIYTYFILIIEIPICILFLCCYFNQKNFSIDNIIYLIFIVGTLQAIITIISYLNFDFRHFINIIYYTSLSRSSIWSNSVEYIVYNRMNGLSSNLTYTTPAIQAVLAIISLHMGVTKNYKYLYFAPLLMLSAIINARSVIIIFSLGFILLIIFNIFQKRIIIKNIFKMSLVLIVMTLIIPLIFEIIKKTSESTYNWLQSGIIEIENMLQGRAIGYFDTLFNSFLNLPGGLSLLFGTGRVIFGIKYGASSDVGYVNDIWLGGIIFTVSIYSLFLSYYIMAFRAKDLTTKFIVAIFISSFLILNIKGSIVSNNDFINISLLLTTVFIERNNGIKRIP